MALRRLPGPSSAPRPRRYFLHSAGKANGPSGDGALSTERRSRHSEAPDTFIYNPANPVPTVGGPLCCDPQHLPAGPRDQKEVEARPDVLVYSTPPLDSDVEVTGPVTLDLYAASSAVDTDFTAKLVDVWPNGFAQNLTEGFSRARYRESTTGPAKLLEPGKIYEYKIDLWSTSNLFLKGHTHPPRSFKQQLPALRPQPEHRQTRIDRLHLRQSHQHRSTTTPPIPAP